MNNWQRISLGILLFGIVLIFVMAFPTFIPGADSTIGPMQIFLLMIGFATVVAAIDLFKSATKFEHLVRYFHQYKSAYGFWLGGPSFYYLTFRLIPLFPVHNEEVLLLKWVSILFTFYGSFSFIKLKLCSDSNKMLITDLRVIFSSHSSDIAACVFYGIYGISLLSPLAANSILPQAPDFANHTAVIVQAKAALDEGQFPLFVAPWQFSGWRLPLFQFYSPLPYTLAAFVYKWFTPGNPYLAMKAMLWLSLAISGIFIYKSAFWLTKSRMAAFLSGVLYMAAPYFLININVRGAFTEAVAQGILPASLYFNLRSATSSKLRYILWSAISWFALATTHIITFIYFALFAGILFLLIGRERRMRVPKFGLAFFIGCALGAYFLIPMASANYLQMYTRVNSSNPYKDRWLTPIETLISPTSVSPIPEPWPPGGTPNLNPAVGWPVLLAVGMLVYFSLSGVIPPYKGVTYRLVFPLLLLFGLAFFMAWSPVDFWRYLPKQFWVIQFPYRLLAQIAWIGSILSAYALTILVGTHFNIRTVIIGLLLIQNSLNSYLPTLQRSDAELSKIVQNPDIGYGQRFYLVSPGIYPFVTSSESVDVPAITTDGWLRLNYEIYSPFRLPVISSTSFLHLEGRVSQRLTDGTTLSIFINRNEIAQKKIGPGPFVWDVYPQGINLRKDSFTLEFRADRTFTTPSDQRHLAILVHSLSFQNLDSKANSLLLTDTQSSCKQHGITTYCSIRIPKDVRIIQLPILYYPGLLDVRVDGVQTSYFPFAHDQYLLVGVQLEPGTHNITVEFQGIIWARLGSRLVWIGMLAFLLLDQIFVFKFYNLYGFARRKR